MAFLFQQILWCILMFNVFKTNLIRQQDQRQTKINNKMPKYTPQKHNSRGKTNLDDQTSGVSDPLAVAGNTGESSGESISATGASTEADDTDLVVNTGIVEAQWATRVTVAGAMSSGSVDTQDIVSNDVTVNGSAFGRRDSRGGHLHQDWRNAFQDTVGCFAPSADQESISNVVGFGGRCQTDGSDFRGEGNGRWQADEGKIIGQGGRIPSGVDGVGGGGDGDLRWLVSGTIVSAQCDAESVSAISAVSRRQNPVGRDQTASAEATAIDKDGHLPGEFMGDSFYSANNAAGIDFALTTEDAGIDSAGLFGWLEITGSLRYWSTGEEIRPGEQLAAKFRDFSRLGENGQSQNDSQKFHCLQVRFTTVIEVRPRRNRAVSPLFMRD
uniref:Uncharacterized protein n=1 Tax=Daphnia magna TaxID=35525 RepID=A0A0P5AMV7_9CRUS